MIKKTRIMKNIKILFLLALTLFAFNACVVEDDENPYYPPNAYGIYPNYTAGANSVYNLLDPNNSIVDFAIGASESGGAVASNGEIHAAINSGTFSKISDIASFPFNVSMSLTDVVTGLGTSVDNLTGGDIVNFKVYFTDSKGVTTTSGGIFSSAIVCPPVAGTYTINMEDSYGDGWQGGGVNAILDGVTTFITLLGDVSSGTQTFVVPEGATALVWEYVDDSYNEEVSFTIYDPNGQLINSSSNPTAGVLSVPSTCP